LVIDVISLARIEEAMSVIDPVFLASPQFPSGPLSAELGFEVVLKIECLNPIRSFKGRGASYFVHRHRDRPHPWVCASAGNFGQGLAYAARAREIPLLVFSSTKANPFKVERMRSLGAEVRLVGNDFDAAKEESRRYAEENGLTFVEDGRDDAIAEGAGTIAIELSSEIETLDAVLVPVGNGALANGIGTWMKARSPATEVIGVGAARAPAMERSFRERRPIALEEPVSTLADGVATRVPVPEAVETMLRVVDDVVLVPEDGIVPAMRTLFRELGLVVEGAGALTLAAAGARRKRFRGKRVALVVGGGNATPNEIREHLFGGESWERC
jgi:threonine dehydratase